MESKEKQDRILCKECMIKSNKKDMVKINRGYVCNECAADMLNNKKSDNTTGGVLINNVINGESNKGSVFWLVFWILFCFPIAIIYFLMKKWV